MGGVERTGGPSGSLPIEIVELVLLVTAGFGGSSGGSSIEPQSSGFDGLGEGFANGAGDSNPVARPQSISSGGSEVSVVTATDGSVVGSVAAGVVLVVEGLEMTGATAGATDSGASKGLEPDGEDGGGG